VTQLEPGASQAGLTGAPRTITTKEGLRPMTANISKVRTTKQCAFWLSEAWGEDISVRNVRYRHGWIFLRDPDYPSEIDCIPAPVGDDIWGEVYSSINLTESPFVEKDKARIKALCDKLTAQLD
jgi:hypothetical protein